MPNFSKHRFENIIISENLGQNSINLHSTAYIIVNDLENNCRYFFLQSVQHNY